MPARAATERGRAERRRPHALVSAAASRSMPPSPSAPTSSSRRRGSRRRRLRPAADDAPAPPHGGRRAPLRSNSSRWPARTVKLLQPIVAAERGQQRAHGHPARPARRRRQQQPTSAAEVDSTRRAPARPASDRPSSRPTSAGPRRSRAERASQRRASSTRAASACSSTPGCQFASAQRNWSRSSSEGRGSRGPRRPARQHAAGDAHWPCTRGPPWHQRLRQPPAVARELGRRPRRVPRSSACSAPQPGAASAPRFPPPRGTDQLVARAAGRASTRPASAPPCRPAPRTSSAASPARATSAPHVCSTAVTSPSRIRQRRQEHRGGVGPAATIAPAASGRRCPARRPKPCRHPSRAAPPTDTRRTAKPTKPARAPTRHDEPSERHLQLGACRLRKTHRLTKGRNCETGHPLPRPRCSHWRAGGGGASWTEGRQFRERAAFTLQPDPAANRWASRSTSARRRSSCRDRDARSTGHARQPDGDAVHLGAAGARWA